MWQKKKKKWTKYSKADIKQDWTPKTFRIFYTHDTDPTVLYYSYFYFSHACLFSTFWRHLSAASVVLALRGDNSIHLDNQTQFRTSHVYQLMKTHGVRSTKRTISQNAVLTYTYISTASVNRNENLPESMCTFKVIHSISWTASACSLKEQILNLPKSIRDRGCHKWGRSSRNERLKWKDWGW